MKKTITTLSASLFVAASAMAGGIITNTNHHISWARMMARGASTEIDAIYTNPAGTAFSKHEGWSLSLNSHTVFQQRDIETTYPLFPEEGHTRKYNGDAFAPSAPSAYLLYKKDRWAFQAFFGVIGGGGKCKYDDGLPQFDAAVMTALYGQHLTPDMYTLDSSLKGSQYIYGGQLGATYRITNNFAAHVGGRINYYYGNYTGHVNATLNNPENTPLAALAINCDQTGVGFTPVLGLDFKWNNLTLATKYEFKTNLSLTNKTKQLEAPAGFEKKVEAYKDGAKTDCDIPAILYVAAGYEIIPNKLRAAVEYHFLDDCPAEMSDNRNEYLHHGTHEVLGGIEWDINKTFTVSAGAQKTDYGLDDGFQSQTAFSCDSYSIGFGAAVNVTEKLRLNVGYFWTTYQDYTKEEEHYTGALPMAGTDIYSRSNKVIGIGFDYKF